MTDIKSLLSDVQTLIDHNHLEQASDTFLSVINDLIAANSPLIPELYYEYALFLFNLHEYELSLMIFKSVYQMEYKKSEIETFIYDSFVKPNNQEFKQCYEHAISSYSENILTTAIPNFEDLSIDFIPFDEDKYLIFDHSTKTFEGTIDLSLEKEFKYITYKDHFSDVTIVDYWNISSVDYLVRSIKKENRLLYFVSSDIQKSLSFLKLPNIMEEYCNNLILVDSLDNFQDYFHKNTSIYLPRVLYNFTSPSSDRIYNIIETEHKYRLTEEGRNKDNILLTIGIPSFNRGHRALESILHLLDSQYDAEIEFLVSNNCSILNTEGYDEIEKLTDSRIHYFKFPDKPGAHINFSHVLNISMGKYTCLLSDEDMINLPAITTYLATFRSNPNISFAKARGSKYNSNNSNKILPMGDQAFLGSFLSTNYVSGLIYRTNLYHSLDIKTWTLDCIYDNPAVNAYAHSCWAMIFSLYGDYYESSTLLFIEGEAEVATKNANFSYESQPILPYATLESRIKQHFGFIQILNQLANKISMEAYILAYMILCNKTYFLLTFVKSQYKKLNTDWDYICEQIHNCCTDGLGEFSIHIDEKEKTKLLDKINELRLGYLNDMYITI